MYFSRRMIENETKMRQEMEARIQTNLDFITQYLQRPSHQLQKYVAVNIAHLESQFRFGITNPAEVDKLELLLKSQINFKENLVFTLICTLKIISQHFSH